MINSADLRTFWAYRDAAHHVATNKFPTKTNKVKFSKELSNEIKRIVAYNHGNTESLRQWRDYLKWVCMHLSRSSVAWDNRGLYKSENGVIFKRESYLDVDYEIVSDANITCICIINIDLKALDYGLRESKNKKGSLLITESKLRRIIAESIQRVLYN